MLLMFSFHILPVPFERYSWERECSCALCTFIFNSMRLLVVHLFRPPKIWPKLNAVDFCWILNENERKKVRHFQKSSFCSAFDIIYGLQCHHQPWSAHNSSAQWQGEQKREYQENYRRQRWLTIIMAQIALWTVTRKNAFRGGQAEGSPNRTDEGKSC